jgi:hypothetical protein
MLFMPGLYGPAQAQAEQNWLSGPVDYSNYMGDMSQGLGQIGPYGPGMGGMGGLLAQQLSMQQSFGGYGGGGFPQQMGGYGGYGGGFPPQMMGGYGGFPPQMMGYGGYGGFPPQMMGGYGGYGGFPPQMMGGYGGFPQQMGGYGGGFDMYGGQRPMVGFGGTPQPTPPSNPYSSMRAVFNQRQQQRAQVQPMQQAQPAQPTGPRDFLSDMFGKMQRANQRTPSMGQPMAMAAVMPQSYDANPEVLPTNYGSNNTFSAAVMPPQAYGASDEMMVGLQRQYADPNQDYRTVTSQQIQERQRMGAQQNAMGSNNGGGGGGGLF